MSFKYLGVNVSYAIDNLTFLCRIIQTVVKLVNQTILNSEHKLYIVSFKGSAIVLFRLFGPVKTGKIIGSLIFSSILFSRVVTVVSANVVMCKLSYSVV